jgi:hypothetical protein
MGKLSITLVSWDYDRIQGIKDGSVQVEGCDVNHIVASPKEIFFRLSCERSKRFHPSTMTWYR